MDKKVDVDIAKKSLALLNDFCSKLNDMTYKLAELEELTMDNMDNNLFIRSSSQSTKNKFSDVSSLIQGAFNNICIAYRLATECCNNEKNSISNFKCNDYTRNKLIENLSLIYEQISRYMEKEDTKIINDDYPVYQYNIEFQYLGSKFSLYSDFNLHELVATTLCVADKAGVMEANSNIKDDDIISPLNYVTFAHCGSVFSVSFNTNHLPCIIKVCADLPDNIVSLDYMLKLYKEKTSK